MKVVVLGDASILTMASVLLLRQVDTSFDVVPVHDERALFKMIWAGVGLVVLHPERSGIDALGVLAEIKRVSQNRVPVLFIFDSVASGLLRSTVDAGLDAAIQIQDEAGTLDFALRSIANNRRFFAPPLSDVLLRPVSDDPLIENLTPKERSVLVLIAQGKSMGAIAKQLGVSVKTIETHRNNLGAKLGKPNKAQLIALALKSGLVSQEQLKVAA